MTVTKPGLVRPRPRPRTSPADPVASLTPPARCGKREVRLEPSFPSKSVTRLHHLKDISTGGDKVEPQDIQCVNGIGEDVAVTRTSAASTSRTSAAQRPAGSPITCTFVNVPVPDVAKTIEDERRCQRNYQLHRGLQDRRPTNDGTLAANTSSSPTSPTSRRAWRSSPRRSRDPGGPGHRDRRHRHGRVYTLTDGVDLAARNLKNTGFTLAVTRNPAAAGYSRNRPGLCRRWKWRTRPRQGLFNGFGRRP